MRGKIIHYNANEGKGLILADGRQFPFDITSWVSEVAPTVNTTVNFELDENDLPKFINTGGEVVSAWDTPVETTVPPSSTTGGPASTPTGDGVPSLQASPQAAESFSVERVLATLGREALGAQALFIVAALFLPFVRTPAIMGITSKTMSAFEFAGSSVFSEYTGGFEMLLFLAFASFLVPVFWRNKSAWLALCVPALATLRGFMAYRSTAAAPDEGAELFRAMLGNQNANKLLNELGADLKYGMGFGMFILIAAAAVLAYFGIMRYRQLS